MYIILQVHKLPETSNIISESSYVNFFWSWNEETYIFVIFALYFGVGLFNQAIHKCCLQNQGHIDIQWNSQNNSKCSKQK